MDTSSGMDSAALIFEDLHHIHFSTLVPTSSPSTPSPNSIHFLPPAHDANNSTAWIIVGVVVGTIIIVFILILVLRQLINMFRNRDYESIGNNSTSSNELNKSIFDNYNNGTVKINVIHHSMDYDNDTSTNTDNTNLSSIIAGGYPDNTNRPIQSTIKSKKRSKKRKPKPSKKRKKSKSKSKKRDKDKGKHLRKITMSQSKSTVNFVSSGSDENDRNLIMDDEDEKIRQPLTRKDSKSNIVTVINSDTNEDSQSTQRGNDDDRVDVQPRNIRMRSRGGSSGSTGSQYGFSMGSNTHNDNGTRSGGNGGNDNDDTSSSND